MAIYAGIDEAGLGPKLGPYVLGTTVFEVPEPFNLARPGQFDFYSALGAAIAPKRVPKAEKVIVNDSKKIHKAGEGVRRLEEALLPFLIASRAATSLPTSLGEFLRRCATVADDDLADYPWYRSGDDRPALAHPVPHEAKLAAIEARGRALADVASTAGVRVLRVDAAVVLVRAFNAWLLATQNKADAAFLAVGRALSSLWNEHGEAGIVARVDRQGGRIQYRKPLMKVFSGAKIEILQESKAESRYTIEHGSRRMVVCFALRSDSLHLPVSLASVLAKYLRERLMDVQNDWFRQHEPTLPETRGYPKDAARWLEQSFAVRKRLGVPNDLLMRDK